MSRRSFRGLIEAGEYKHCGTVPQCMGAASGSEEQQSYRCTCPSFSREEIEFAREHLMTIEHESQMPVEWRIERGHPPSGGAVREGHCESCNRLALVAGEWTTLCERCTRERLALFTENRKQHGARRLQSVKPVES